MKYLVDRAARSANWRGTQPSLWLMFLVLFLCGAAVSAQVIVGFPESTTGSVGSEAFLAAEGRAQAQPVDEVALEALLARMTVTEKIGQMTQLDIFMITDGLHQEMQINPDKLREMVTERAVGSILNVNGEALSVERWHGLIRAIQNAATASRLKIPVIYGLDSIHGANYVESATIFPQPLGLAATFNPELTLKGSRLAAAETRKAGVPWNFSPVLDVGRHPAWPRLYETFGEDPYLVSVFGVASIRGYEGRRIDGAMSVASTMKHFLGYSEPVTGHDRTPSRIPERRLHEIFVPPFRAAVNAGARTVMINSGEINGIPVHGDRRMLTELLREELGFRGVAVTDWEDIKKLVTLHRVAVTEKQATLMAINAGVDMSMVPRDASFMDLMAELVAEGSISEARLDLSVRRILRLKFELGLFSDPLLGVDSEVEVGSTEARKVALAAARESIVLLENRDATLPLDEGTRLLITGPTADSLESLANGWTYTWQGHGASNYPEESLSLVAGLSAMARNRVHYLPTPRADINVPSILPGLRRESRKADVVILCLGEQSYTETPGNIDDLRLPKDQLELARAAYDLGKPVVLVLIQGRPRVLDGIADAAAAVLFAPNPGHEGGQAIAEVLLGMVNPSGKLPITYPRFTNALRTYDFKQSERQDTTFGLTAFNPQWPFGHGLSYTTFEVSDLTLTESSAGLRESVGVSYQVTNTGQRAGLESTLLFVTDEVASITPSAKRLRRFQKVFLEPGKSVVVEFTLGPADFEFVRRDLERIVEPGDFVITVGDQSATLTLERPAE